MQTVIKLNNTFVFDKLQIAKSSTSRNSEAARQAAWTT